MTFAKCPPLEKSKLSITNLLALATLFKTRSLPLLSTRFKISPAAARASLFVLALERDLLRVLYLEVASRPASELAETLRLRDAFVGSDKCEREGGTVEGMVWGGICVTNRDLSREV